MNEQRKGSEQHLNRNIDYTLYPFEHLDPLYSFPRNASGLTTLDIGAGQNATSAILRERGANAFAVDPGYDFPEELQELIDSHHSEDSKTAEWYVKTRERFQQDFQQFREYYKAAKSLSLPFKSNTFDLIYSNYCICPVISKDTSALSGSIREILRTLKPFGIAKIFPFDNAEDIRDGNTLLAQGHQSNLDGIIRLLDRSPHGFELRAYSFSGENRIPVRNMLIIEKSDKGR